MLPIARERPDLSFGRRSSDNPVMASLAADNQVGDALTVLWTEGPETRVAFAHVASEVPFGIQIEGENQPLPGADLRLVRDQGERWVAGSAAAAFCDEGLVLLRNVAWEEPSQRVHERTEVNWPTTLRILDDRGARESYRIGMTMDVSLGGAAVLMDDAPEVGSLVEVKAHPSDAAPMRAVGVVVRRTGYDIGLAFLYLWGAAHLQPPVAEVRLRRAA